MHLLILESTDVNPENYPDYELFLEARSHNKVLKANSLFLYQVFPGNTTQWLRILHQAINENDYSGTENLLSLFKENCFHLVDSNEKSSGNVALHLACQNGYFDIALLLLENGASVNKRDGNNQKPIHYAMRGQYRDVCQLLIEWGSRILDQSNGQIYYSTSKYTLKEFCKEYSERWQAAVSRVLKGDTEPVKEIVEDHESGKHAMASLRSRCIDGSTLLHVAAYFGEDTCVERLLKLSVDTDVLDYKGATPLQRCKDAKTMQILLKYGADVNWKDNDGNTALHMMCYGEPGESMMDCIQLLLTHKASIRKSNKKGLLPIHCAAMQGRQDVLQLLIESDPKERELINENMTKRDTPSLPFLALMNGHLESAKWLISNMFHFTTGEDVELLFDMVCSKDRNDSKMHIVNFLIRHGLNVNNCDKNGNSPLHLAVLYIENYDIVKLLLSYKAEVNAVNKDLNTPLFTAIKSSNFHGAKLLMDYGANLDYQDREGLTAFDHIKNIDDWIASGIFSDDINELLRAYDLRESIQLVRQVADRIKIMKQHKGNG
ncbi:hypothetical protein GDO81_010418 [Engystomops pustulosus]|uniref:Uncharacterized protein n=1 Tax=Engystomops pustulosus TaxID=76066 RepID=A0AAV7C167_ENGPU|nr:hypothetical protein GDO81_010418 [Engystomops pustulosus]